MAGLFAWHFNQGLRANFFALALLGWWVSAWFFIASTSVILWVLFRREFCSKSLIVVNNIHSFAEPVSTNKNLLVEFSDLPPSGGLFNQEAPDHS